MCSVQSAIRWGHLSGHIDRRRINLDCHIADLGCNKSGRLSLGFRLLKLYILHKIDVVVSGHTLSSSSCVPGGIRDLLHFKKGVGCRLVFNASILILSVEVLSVVLFRIHQTDILFKFLSESLRERFFEVTFCLIDCLLDHQ